MPPGTPHKGSDARRRAILDAALACFVAKGYDSATMADIREAAGASIGSLYHHYRSKEALASALVVESLRSYQQAWLDRLGDDVARSVRSAVLGHFDWLDHNQQLATVLFGHPGFGELARVSPEVGELRHEFSAQLMSWIRPRIGRGGFAHLPDDVYEPLWMGAAQEMTRGWIGWQRLGDLSILAEQFAEGAWAALRWRRS
jgi:AcrR family transcriptional regulator